MTACDIGKTYLIVKGTNCLSATFFLTHALLWYAKIVLWHETVWYIMHNVQHHATTCYDFPNNNINLICNNYYQFLNKNDSTSWPSISPLLLMTMEVTEMILYFGCLTNSKATNMVGQTFSSSWSKRNHKCHGWKDFDSARELSSFTMILQTSLSRNHIAGLLRCIYSFAVSCDHHFDIMIIFYNTRYVSQCNNILSSSTTFYIMLWHPSTF